ncbi:phosphoribosylaminoimidazolesuccinocarboxamide synthase [bacterium endosymbiont of Bathymodiolus sp. 5 South]|jgi:phosphoribosylaminoimidazole-succinocarboxamide synthase|uniref:phosphoribosylaminoimidazolesuccinocarboxamide synthase n=1 Tax=bacterium endosymbiont of Bathymodiolus sp. 5 South TaxID=1181670 RepID=UPI0010B69051|nr:phosphoribosylaminoimidazolesuccinocarboxamide synthase [bacterium endosymbiont of Bathymodiolus sp. 5 South]CAC9635286.1 Phosphoribosylaminoimidazole-succinocarboxamide synthase (EC 6.3.2.6) [uncultured Gammaproteobacteria bacterium]CAC9657649.1 Phosphoribosylaminoimidazole-succinocarboxamide synthase (EC 6.3.2.6) [uncultured Gammaproteobacteria bacterium]SHN89942.1 Phosphoribosylaminoimidazole-succinocarboxamide synthase [bacterium endosymbiont of Bathymodiolus sp. 5 South]SSC08000.1 Phosp
MQTLFETSLSLPLVQKGKVRDIYDIDEYRLLIVTTDRLSAFDVVFNQPISGKGRVLTEVANFWFEKTHHIIANQLTHESLDSVLTPEEIEQVDGRAIIVKKLKPLPVEAIVRGYIIGSGWKDYQQTGSVCGIQLPTKLRLAEKLPETLYTPSSKAAVGQHDENIDFEQTVQLVGKDLAQQIKDVSLALYQFAADYVLERGIIIADTKFEFGLDETGKLTLMDEVLTPDSSRFWSKADYQVGISPKSFDKQIVRDYLETLDWDKTPPAPTLPDNIVQETADKYKQVQRLLTQ